MGNESGDRQETGANLSELGRALAAARHTSTHPCTVCGKPVEGLSTRLYCSERCRKAAYRARKRTRAEAQQDNGQTGTQEA